MKKSNNINVVGAVLSAASLLAISAGMLMLIAFIVRPPTLVDPPPPPPTPTPTPTVSADTINEENAASTTSEVRLPVIKKPKKKKNNRPQRAPDVISERADINDYYILVNDRWVWSE